MDLFPPEGDAQVPNSMTGFGVADGPFAGGRVQAEIRSVNHRHLNLQCRMPSALQAFEEPVREAVRSRLERGHVTLTVRWLEEPARTGTVVVNTERAGAVVSALSRLKEEFGLDGTIDVGVVARYADVLVTEEVSPEAGEARDLVVVVEQALERLVEMRRREGAVLCSELGGRLDSIETALARVSERAPVRVTAERDRLRRAVSELLDGRPVDDQRLAQEIAFLAERLDITEEMVRLAAHLAAARTALADDRAQGRTLSFLGQEMLREINTIGSKANDALIAQDVIAMKGELEKYREQLENLE